MNDDYYKLRAEAVTREHIQRVAELLGKCATELIARGVNHDKSKLEDPELPILATVQEIVDKNGYSEYGSPEYYEVMRILKPMHEHHYANNRHHPEYYPDGVNGMTLFDLIEMFIDWKAASDRANDPLMHISHSTKRYGIDTQLATILRNTADYLDFKHN